MKLARMMLIGSVLYIFNSIGIAGEFLEEPDYSNRSEILDIALPAIYYESESDNTFDNFDVKSNFLLAYSLASGYSMGIKYLDLNAEHELQNNNDDSQLWIGLQFSF